jgi:hypothetical protein
MEPTIASPKPEQSTAERLIAIVNDAAKHAEELMKAELAVAKDELKNEVRAAKGAAIVFGVAAALAHCSLFCFAAALVLALGGTPLAAAGIGLLFAAVAGALFFAGKKLLSAPPMKRTRDELSRDIHMLTESTHE